MTRAINTQILIALFAMVPAFATLAFAEEAPDSEPAEPDMAALAQMMSPGAQLYMLKGCHACHGAEGAGIPALEGTPLAGQMDVYLAQQLRNYRSGLRGAHADDLLGRQMSGGVAGLKTEQDIVDVSVYLATLGAAAETARPSTPEGVVASFYRRLDGRDKNAIYDILHPDVVIHFPDRQVVGPAGYWAYVSQVALLIPDYERELQGIEVDEQDPSMVQVRNISISGSLANGEKLTLPGSARYRVVEGKIVEAWIG